MTIIQTQISEEHLELLKLFFKANELPNVNISTYAKEEKYMHNFIELSFDDNDEDTSSQLMYMSIRHAGFENMLEHYLLKCGVSIKILSPMPVPQVVTDDALNEHLSKILKKV